jgi:type I restriction enzyme M protein
MWPPRRLNYSAISRPFQGAGVKTVVLFFEKGAPTRKIWFYKLVPGRNFGKTNPLNDDDLKDFVALQAKFKDSENSWTVDVKTIDKATFDLSVRNPNKADEVELRDPAARNSQARFAQTESAGVGLSEEPINRHSKN